MCIYLVKVYVYILKKKHLKIRYENCLFVDNLVILSVLGGCKCKIKIFNLTDLHLDSPNQFKIYNMTTFYNQLFQWFYFLKNKNVYGGQHELLPNHPPRDGSH